MTESFTVPPEVIVAYVPPPRPWSVLPKGGKIPYTTHDGRVHTSEAVDACIVDANGLEVVGSSEWIIGEEHLQFICDVVNAAALKEPT